MADATAHVPLRAAVFDLFGTLVPEFPHTGFEEMVHDSARALGVDEAAFMEGWNATANERQTGRYPGGIAENVLAIVERMGEMPPTDEDLARALAPRDAMYERWFVPRPGAIETITALRDRGVPLGLISMCAPDTPALWRASPFAGLFDVEVFSSEVGLRKPDPAIYRYAIDRLGVPAEATLYCGDGSYRELTGADAVGMVAVEIRSPDVVRGEQLRPEGDDWQGAWVADLRELLDRF
jgi:putative hydrolase of the HAD superfamily